MGVENTGEREGKSARTMLFVRHASLLNDIEIKVVPDCSNMNVNASTRAIAGRGE
ncbi:hypothetical protein BDN71DRAFT_1459134 [Pleurotus eryngii]|uniref:Uncharacterized protein n=1 Tax=Pleurotus eryngii TaxID=5323 RepID=A0A9P6CZU6_PLEER|nr:hypothetical protein BDN71DRAFT_1459134 [Pleurotus eryngii]